MRVGRGLTLLLLLTASACADDDDLPVYDIKGFCQAQASLATPNVRELEQRVLKQRALERCYRQQLSAYDALRLVWPKTPTQIRAKYDAAVRSKELSGGFGDYELLNDRLLVEIQRSHDARRQENINPGR
jgi:hypothetical protein